MVSIVQARGIRIRKTTFKDSAVQKVGDARPKLTPPPLSETCW